MPTVLFMKFPMCLLARNAAIPGNKTISTFLHTPTSKSLRTTSEASQPSGCIPLLALVVVIYFQSSHQDFDGPCLSIARLREGFIQRAHVLAEERQHISTVIIDPVVVQMSTSTFKKACALPQLLQGTYSPCPSCNG